ncbi:MAG: hypothetical protein ACHQ7N_21690 [Candidatus Methylomirabilales bacterium]
MMPSEFDTRIGRPLPATEWPVIHRIYAYHPDIKDVGGKDQLASLYTNYGFSRLADLMLATANQEAAKSGEPPVAIEIEQWYGTEVISDSGTHIETRPKTLRQVYEYLRTGLGTLIDEYFSICPEPAPPAGPDAPWPLRTRWIAVFPVTGGSEGSYIHVEAIHQDGHRELLFLAKTFRGMSHAWAIAQRLGELLYI